MNSTRSIFGTCCALLTLSFAPLSAQIERVQLLTAAPERFGRTEFVIILQAPWSDPFDSHDVRLDLEITGPSGARLVTPCYYESGLAGAPSVWRARCSPSETGPHVSSFSLTAGTHSWSFVGPAFEVASSRSRGFLRIHDGWTFRFDTGEAFRGLGQNIGWEARSHDDSQYFRALHEHPRFNYDYMLGSLAAHGGNFARTWMCSWNLPLEWNHVVDTNRYTADSGRFNASAIRRMDELVDLAERRDIRLMLTLDTAGSLLGRDWGINAYNVSNGGPAERPVDFFINPAARARYKDRLRYIVARWGYSTHLAVWEFFNEIDNAMYGQQEPIADATVVAWHTEMSAHLASLDQHRRPITTSISHREVAGLNSIPAIDLNQRHIYGPPLLVATGLRDHSADAKPYVIGEYAFEWDWKKDFNTFAESMDAGFRNSLWYGLFSATPIMPMTWWWEYFDERGMTAYYQRVRTILDLMIRAGDGSFTPAEATWEGIGITPLAVRCGASTFVLLINETTMPATGAVSLPGTSVSTLSAHLYDAGSGGFTALPRSSQIDNRISGLTIQPGAAQIIIIGDRTDLIPPSR